MGRIFFVIAAIFFFLAVVKPDFISGAIAWGLLAMAIGLAVGDYWPEWRAKG